MLASLLVAVSLGLSNFAVDPAVTSGIL